MVLAVKKQNLEVKQRPPIPLRRMGVRWATASASSFKGPTASSRGGLEDALRPLGLTGRQLIILGAIAEYRKLRQSELAEVVGR